LNYLSTLNLGRALFPQTSHPGLLDFVDDLRDLASAEERFGSFASRRAMKENGYQVCPAACGEKYATSFCRTRKTA
jgi:hypothetical protein